MTIIYYIYYIKIFEKFKNLIKNWIKNIKISNFFFIKIYKKLIIFIIFLSLNKLLKNKKYIIILI